MARRRLSHWWGWRALPIVLILFSALYLAGLVGFIAKIPTPSPTRSWR
jgi:hypothetical protein